MPILAMPYIVAKVGIGHYGAFIFFHSFMGLLSVVINYGFLQTGVRDIANCKTIKKINYEYSHIFYSRFLLLLIVISASLLFLIFDKFNNEKFLYLSSFLYLLVTFLDISFVYQGIEQLNVYVMMNLLGSVSVLLCLFLFINHEPDYVYLPIIFACPRIFFSLLAIFYLYFRFNIGPAVFSARGVTKKLKSGFVLLVSNLCMIAYTRGTLVMLGFFANDAYVGYYSIADQLVYAYSIIQGKVSTVYQPQIAQGFKNNSTDGILKAKENILLMAITSIAGFVFIQGFAYEILYLFLKNDAGNARFVLMILSLNIISISLNSIFGIQILLSIYKEGELLRPSIYAAVLNLLLGSVLIYYFKHIGAAVSSALIEVIILAYYYLRVKSYDIKVLSGKMVQRLGGYTLILISLAFLMRYIADIFTFNPMAKLMVIGTLYSLIVGGVVQSMKMIDFRTRRVITGTLDS